MPATTVPPTVVALRPKRAETVARAQLPDWEVTPVVTNRPCHRYHFSVIVHAYRLKVHQVRIIASFTYSIRSMQ